MRRRDCGMEASTEARSVDPIGGATVAGVQTLCSMTYGFHCESRARPIRTQCEIRNDQRTGDSSITRLDLEIDLEAGGTRIGPAFGSTALLAHSEGRLLDQ